MGRSDIDATDDELGYRIACCFADQAYSYAYDVGLKSYEERLDRFLSAIEFYDRALTVGSRYVVCMCGFYGAYNCFGLVRQVSGFSTVSVSA